MTSRTAGQHFRPLDVIALYQIAALLLLVCRRPPFHVENLVFRSHIVFRMAVTIQTPFHLQRLRLRHDRHLVNPAVAGRAANPFVYVD